MLTRRSLTSVLWSFVPRSAYIYLVFSSCISSFCLSLVSQRKSGSVYAAKNGLKPNTVCVEPLCSFFYTMQLPGLSRAGPVWASLIFLHAPFPTRKCFLNELWTMSSLWLWPTRARHWLGLLRGLPAAQHPGGWFWQSQKTGEWEA